MEYIQGWRKLTTKSLVYKVARFNDQNNGHSLQNLVTKALKSKKAAINRRQQTDSENHFRLINFNGPYKGMRVGEMFDYTKGQKQPSALVDEKAEELTLSAISPPNKKSEFLHSILYFGVKGNAVVLSQSMSLRSLQLEDYINWLLRSCGLIQEEDYIILSDQPPLDKRKKIHSTKGIELHSPVDLKPSKPVSIVQDRKGKSNQEVTDTKSISLSPSGLGWDALKKILPSEISLPASINADDIISNRSLEVKVMLTWSKTFKDDPTKFLDDISNQLRHVDSEVDYSIITKSGKITRDEIKLKRSVNVATNDEGMIKKEEMWEAMHSWLDSLVNDDKINIDI